MYQRLRLPNYVNLIASNVPISCEDWQRLHLALGDKQAVKRIRVYRGKIVDPLRVTNLNWQGGKAVELHAL